jgi:hypothetical protein
VVEESDCDELLALSRRREKKKTGRTRRLSNFLTQTIELMIN